MPGPDEAEGRPPPAAQTTDSSAANLSSPPALALSDEPVEHERTEDQLAPAAAEESDDKLRHGVVEAIEESSSSSLDDSEKEKEKDNDTSLDLDDKDNANHYAVRRTQSNWTQNTTTSLATDDQPDPASAASAPAKRKWKDILDPFKHRHSPPVPSERLVSREYGANFFSKLTFQWVHPLMSVGYQRPLEFNDVWSINPDRAVNVLTTKLRAAFARRQAAGSSRALAMAIFDTFRGEFLFGGFCALISALLQVLTPFTMKYLINFAGEAYIAHKEGRPEPNIGRGVGLVIGISCMQLLQSTSTNHWLYRGMMVGGEARSVLISIIFDKAMRLSGRAKAGTSLLMRGNDANPDAAAGQGAAEEKRPDGMEAGSKEEKKWMEKKLKGERKKKGKQAENANIEGWSNGRIVNLMSTDTYRVDQGFGWFHITWTSPIQVVVALILLLINLSYSALAGFAFIVIMVPLLGRSVRTLMNRRKIVNKITDQRVSLTQEIISSVRFVKYFGWELSFLDRLAKIRSNEVGKIAFLLSIRNGIMAVGLSTPIFAAMLAFITRKLTAGPSFTAGPVFSSLALFNSLRIPLNLLPTVIGQVVDAFASIKRIEDFLNAEEVHDEAEWNDGAGMAIDISRADFTWETTRTQENDKAAEQALRSTKQVKKDEKAAKAEKKRIARTSEIEKSKTPQSSTSSPALVNEDQDQDQETPFSIRNIDLAVGRHELVAVIGAVGSGKSSLLGALAGDMRKTEGKVTFGSNRAFCPQYAWIQNASVRKNILFGKDYDRKFYNEVVDACALRPDLEMLPQGDDTEIGERGITVSGGQKQRLNIARAIYFDADIILLDDPLSAVDAHVGRHIMDHAICGLLRDKCRVLATHQLHILHRVDRIVWMKDGGIHKIATFPELMASDPEFQQLMATTAVEEEDKKKKQSEDDDGAEGEKKRVQKKKPKASALMQQEEKAVDSVGWTVYSAYFRAMGSIWFAPLILLLLAISQGANILTSLWLSWWTSGKFGLPLGEYIGIYAGLGVVQAVLMFAFAATTTTLAVRASKVMLNRAILRVLRSPMSFFDTTPIGRITNRFAKDVDVMDNMLADSIRMSCMNLAQILSIFILIIAYYYYFAVALGPLMVIFLFSARYYRKSAREMKRHEAVLRSVVFSRFGEAVTGTATIRAYGMQQHFANTVDSAIDVMDSAYFLTYANQRWLSVRLDSVGNLMVFVLGILVVTSRFTINPSVAGLVLSYMLSVVQLMTFTVRQIAEVENNMNSTERLHYYGTELEQEAPLHIGDVRSSWPEKGEIVFDNVEMRYRAGLPLVLKGLNLRVKAGERIGVVGRTGAGKSSIMSALFRLIELSGGNITIDGVNIATIGLHDLRSRLAIIPQDPTLFKGTIRSNLDPFNQHPDLELWNALRQADLIGADQEMSGDSTTGRITLESPVDDEGLNFSLGQRQLLALARALVRGSQIIVCDEATSSVDFETDQKIQKTIVRGFNGKTLLCIAHRLKTIIGYDRILVMDAGNVAELDAPLALYDRPDGIFRGMCERSGIRREDFFTSEEANFAAESPTVERSIQPKNAE